MNPAKFLLSFLHTWDGAASDNEMEQLFAQVLIGDGPLEEVLTFRESEPGPSWTHPMLTNARLLREGGLHTLQASMDKARALLIDFETFIQYP